MLTNSNLFFSILSSEPHSKRPAYVAGMAMAAPFAAATLPYPWLLLSIPMGIPFVIHLAKNGIVLPEFRRIPLIVWPIVFLALLHIYGLLTSTTPYWLRVVIDMTIVSAGLGVFLIGCSESNYQGDMLKGFFTALILFVFPVAVLGVVKAALLERGIIMGFLFDLYHGQYPSGSSLRADYNLFGLSMLIAGLGIVIKRFQGEHGPCRNAWQLFVLAVLISAGMLTASRRFLVFLTLIPILWLTVGMLLVPLRELPRKVLLPIAGTACIVGLILFIVKNPTPVQDARVYSVGTPSKEISDFTIRKTDPDLLVRVVNQFQANYIYGFDTRLPKWRFGVGLLANGNWIGGTGFAYHGAFSCCFAGCSFLDYPHFPIMSEVLIGGVWGGCASIAVYLLLFFSIWRTGWKGLISGSSAIVLAVIPFSMMSGDTLFSVPQFIIICLLVQDQLASGKHAIQDAVLR